MSGHSGEQYLDFLRLLIYGPAGCGKTTLAASLSKNWKGAKRQAKRVTLSDVYWLSCDAGATECLEALNYRVAESRLQDGYMRLPRPGERKLTIRNPMEAYSKMLSDLSAAVQKGVEIVVLDTASELNNTYLGYLVREMFTTNKERGRGVDPYQLENRQLYGKLLMWEKAGFRQLLQLPCHLIILSHIKQVIDYGDADSAAKKQQALTGSDGLKFQPAVAGNALQDYHNSMSLTLWLEMRKKGSITERFLGGVTNNKGEYVTKSRFSHLLAPKESADLGSLYKKLLTTKR